LVLLNLNWKNGNLIQFHSFITHYWIVCVCDFRLNPGPPHTC
jgi:hypothetical protein